MIFGSKNKYKLHFLGPYEPVSGATCFLARMEYAASGAVQEECRGVQAVADGAARAPSSQTFSPLGGPRDGEGPTSDIQEESTLVAPSPDHVSVVCDSHHRDLRIASLEVI